MSTDEPTSALRPQPSKTVKELKPSPSGATSAKEPKSENKPPARPRATGHSTRQDDKT